MLLAVDMGGTKTAWRTLSVTGETVSSGAWFTKDIPPSRFSDALASALQADRRNVTGIGVSIAAATKGTTIVFAPNLRAWEQVNFAELLAEWKVPIVLTYDGQSSLLGQHWHDHGRWNDAIMIAIGTGIGGAIYSGGHLLTGETHLAGVVGALRFEGRTLEEWASGVAIAARCEVASGRQALVSYRQGDPQAVHVFEQAHRALEYAISQLSGVLDISTVFIGGGMGIGAFAALMPHETLQEKAKIHPITQRHVHIRPAFSEAAALYGSVAHWFVDSHLSNN